MIPSRHQFEEDAILLCQYLVRVATAGDYWGDGFALSAWVIVEEPAGNGDIYLEHPPVLTNNSTTHAPSIVDEEFDSDADLEDDTVLLDPEQQHQHQQQQQQQQQSQQHTAEPVDPRAPEPFVQWHFSIVYSDTYRVPVLYFHVQDQHGAPYSRSQVVQWLSHSLAEGTSTTSSTAAGSTEDSWEFVSQEQHPHTGFPSYFLHPCQTAQRMKFLAEGGGGCKDKEDEADLWSWMAMILPSVNCPIAAQVFVNVRRELPARVRK